MLCLFHTIDQQQIVRERFCVICKPKISHQQPRGLCQTTEHQAITKCKDVTELHNTDPPRAKLDSVYNTLPAE